MLRFYWVSFDRFKRVNLNRPYWVCLTVFSNIVPQRNCKIKVGSAEKSDSARGGDSALVHCTEVAFWVKTENKTPEQIVRSACSGVLFAPLTMEIYESTANGTGNYFHQEWERAKRGESDKEPLFVPWFDIEMYELPFADPIGLLRRSTRIGTTGPTMERMIGGYGRGEPPWRR